MSDFAMVVTEPGGPEKFERREIRTPRPGPGEALVRQTAVGLNYLDVYHRSGLYPWAVERDLLPGSEGAGVVEAVGPGVEEVEPGDRVAYTHPLGAYASARTIVANRLVQIPEAITDTQAASLMLKGLTAHYLIHSTYPVQPGMTVLVQAAAGGVGLLLGQWLAAKGVTAIGTAGGPEKVEIARAHGYSEVIDYHAEDFALRARELSGGEGVHAVYDGVGRDTWRGSLAALRIRGTFVNFGQASGMIEGFTLAELAKFSHSACRPMLFHYIADPAELRARARDLFAAVLAGEITAEVRQTLPLAEVAEAHRALEARATTGATVLTLD